MEMEEDLEDEEADPLLTPTKRFKVSKEAYVALHIVRNRNSSDLKRVIQTASEMYTTLINNRNSASAAASADEDQRGGGGSSGLTFKDLCELDVENMDAKAASEYLRSLYMSVILAGPDPTQLVGESWLTLTHDTYTEVVGMLYKLLNISLQENKESFHQQNRIFKQLLFHIGNLYCLAQRSRSYHNTRMQMRILGDRGIGGGSSNNLFTESGELISSSAAVCTLVNTTMYNDLGVQLQHLGKEVYNKSVSVEQHTLAIMVNEGLLHDGQNVYEPVRIFIKDDRGKKKYISSGAYRLLNTSHWMECTPFEAICQRRSQESTIENWISTRLKNFLPPHLTSYVNSKSLASSIASITTRNMRYNGNYYTYVVDQHGHIYDSWTLCMRRPGQTTTMKRHKGQPLLVAGNGELLYSFIMGKEGSDIFNFFDGAWYKTTMKNNFWYQVASYQVPSRYKEDEIPIPQECKDFSDVKEDANYWTDDVNPEYQNDYNIRKYNNQQMVIKSQLAVYGRMLHYPKTFDDYHWITVHHGESGTGKSTRMWMQALMYHPGQAIQIDSRPGSSRQEFGGSRKCNSRLCQFTEVDSKSTLKRGFFLESASNGSVECNDKNKEIRSLKFQGHIEMGQNVPPYKALIHEYPSAWLRRQPTETTFYYTRTVQEDMNDESRIWQTKSLLLTLHAESVSLFSALLMCNGQPLQRILCPQYTHREHANNVLSESIVSCFLSTGAIRAQKGSLLPFTILTEYFAAYVRSRRLYGKNAVTMDIDNWNNLRRITDCEVVSIKDADLVNVNKYIFDKSSDQKSVRPVEIVCDSVTFPGGGTVPTLKGIRYPPLISCSVLNPSKYYVNADSNNNRRQAVNNNNNNASQNNNNVVNAVDEEFKDIWDWETSRDMADIYISGLTVGPAALNTSSYAFDFGNSGLSLNTTAIHAFYDAVKEPIHIQRKGQLVMQLKPEAAQVLQPKEMETYSTYLEITNHIGAFANKQRMMMHEQKIADSLPPWYKLHRYDTLKPSFFKRSAIQNFVHYKRVLDASGDAKHVRVDMNKVRAALAYRTGAEVAAWSIIKAHVRFTTSEDDPLILLCKVRINSTSRLWQGERWENNIMQLIRICDILAERYHHRLHYSSYKTNVEAINSLMAFCYQAKLASASLEQHATTCRAVHV